MAPGMCDGSGLGSRAWVRGDVLGGVRVLGTHRDELAFLSLHRRSNVAEGSSGCDVSVEPFQHVGRSLFFVGEEVVTLQTLVQRVSASQCVDELALVAQFGVQLLLKREATTPSSVHQEESERKLSFSTIQISSHEHPS